VTHCRRARRCFRHEARKLKAAASVKLKSFLSNPIAGYTATGGKAVARLSEFRGIEGENFFKLDRGFQKLLSDLLPAEDRSAVFESLEQCASLVSGRWGELAREASREENLPRIVKFDRRGNRIEQVELGPFTKQLRQEVANFGVLTNVRSELHKFALVYLLAHNGEASLGCPIAATDGLIRAIEAKGPDSLREVYLPLLRSAEIPFAGAQFVTEREAGSDVGAIETIASPRADGTWSITGEKWFCSNPSEFFAVAARPEGSPTGTDGVALFLVPRLLPDGQLNSISLRRLKNKLGTRSLPTAEIDFSGAIAYEIGNTSEGFKTLMNYLINVSRVHNAVNACGFLHRAFLEARNYAGQRRAFSNEIIRYPMVQESLVVLLEKLWRSRVLTFRLVAMIAQNGLVPKEEGLAMWQRLLINLAKYRTASRLTEQVRDSILLLGGNGIIEDFTVLPRLLRDALVIETWEGTHNTLCLQILRDAARSDLLDSWQREIARVLQHWPRDFLSLTRRNFESYFNRTLELISRDKIADAQWSYTHARRLVDRLGSLLELAWMAEIAMRDSVDATAALLTSVAGSRLLADNDLFDHPIMNALPSHALELISEQPIRAETAML
jgi:acyl-CoA dehydrogenase